MRASPSALPSVWTSSVMPLRSKMSGILPTPITGTFASTSRSSTVGPGVASAKSLRWYVRTYRRKDFAMATPGPTVLDRLVAAKVPVVGVGKIPDIFDHKGITEEIHTEGNADGLARTEALLDRVDRGLVFVNLVDFDMLYGHRNDPRGYARALEELDRALPRLFARLRPGDLCAITADHGCDPTTPSTDHSREYVPLLVHAPGRGGGDLGTRASFADLGATVSEFFGLRAEVGTSFLGAVS